MSFIRVMYLMCFSGIVWSFQTSSDPEELADAIMLQGDIILGGLFPMHEKGTGGKLCGALKEEKGIQRVEAMLYAIDAINNDEKILPGIDIGAHILDTCLRDTYALEQSLAFIKAHMSSLNSQNQQDCHPDYVSPELTIRSRPVAGVIGAAASPVSIMVANILRLFKIPQISYASTGIDLSDKSRFQYFSRVVPPDTYQAQAMVDVVKTFNWTYVATLADEGNYGEKGIDTFKDLAEQQGICIAKSMEIPREIKNDTFSKIIKSLKENANKAKVVVLFVNEDNCHRLVKAAAAAQAADHFYWLASDSWGAKEVPVKQQEAAAVGTVTILPQREVVKEFDRYFTRLNPRDNTRNPWFKEYWEKHFQCEFDRRPDVKHCTGWEKISKRGYQQEGIVPFVIDAVYAMAHALHNMVKSECHGANFCSAVDAPSGETLLKFIRNVTFTGVTGNVVRFNENGDAMGRYTIYQFQQRPNGQYEYVPIGNWSDSLVIDHSLTKWKLHDDLPRSVCSEPCPPGHMKRNDDALDKCCWVCLQCEAHKILKDESTCEPCPNGSYPDALQSKCYELPIDYMSLDSAWAIVPVVVASLGVVMTIFVAAVFMKYNRTPVIMASGRELCYVLMVGVLLCYIMTFIMVSKPTLVTCCLMRMGLGLSLSICYAAMFTKTNRISRIFNRGVKAMVKRPSYTSPRSQLVICFCLVSVQIIGAITWLGMDLPDTTLVYPDRETVVLRCKSTNIAIVISLLYNMILIILCTVYAFKTRKIPENFNEAKHLAFTMYSTCIVWLAFIPIYFGTNKSDFRIQVTALCMCLSISATVALGCLFVPKVYIVLFQPHKNVRQGAKGGIGGSGRPLFGASSNRFSSLAAMNGDITSPSNTLAPVDNTTSLSKDESTCISQLAAASGSEEPDGLFDKKYGQNGSHQLCVRVELEPLYAGNSGETD